MLMSIGIGEDGGLMAMKGAGAWATAQNEKSSLVYDMPRVARQAGACCELLTLEGISARMLALLSRQGTLVA